MPYGTHPIQPRIRLAISLPLALSAPDVTLAVPCTITIPFVLVEPVTVAPDVVVVGVPRVVVVVGETTPMNPVVVAIEVPMVPVQLFPAQQHATCPAQSYVQMPFDVQHTLAALSVEQELQFWRLTSSRSIFASSGDEQLTSNSAEMRFGGENGQKTSSLADIRLKRSVNGRRMAWCIVQCVFKAENA